MQAKKKIGRPRKEDKQRSDYDDKYENGFQKVSTRIPNDLMRAAKAIAEKEGITVSTMMRQLLIAKIAQSIEVSTEAGKTE